MSLASRLTLPALFGGIIALLGSGVFAPPVHARGYHVETVARVTSVAADDTLNVRRWPASYSQKVGELPPKTLVWVERCIEVDNSSDWCLVERGGIAGWVNSRFLTPQSL